MSATTESRAQQLLGKEIVQNLLVAFRSAQLYEADNETMMAAASRLASTIRDLIEIENGACIEVGQNLILVNEVRIRSELRHHSVHTNVIRVLQELGIGGFEWLTLPEDEAISRFARVIGRAKGGETDSTEAVKQLMLMLQEQGVGGVQILPPRLEAQDIVDDPEARERAERTYRHSVAVTRNLMESVRAGRSLKLQRVKRAVQRIVDHVLEDETLLVGLTNLRDFDEPTFSHSVNVSIFSVALGQRIGLSRDELYELGMAALLHDIGKVDVPNEVLNKSERLTEEEWAIMQKHPALGALRILEDRTPGAFPFRSMLVAFEHHLNIDLSGYPQLFAPRKLSFFSKIVSIADAFDAGTTPRVYKTVPITAPEMLSALTKWTGTRFDPILVKAFVTLLGIYPPGSVCLLDTFELGIVTALDEDPANLDRPLVRIVVDPNGNRVEGPTVNLTQKTPDGEYERTIIKIVEADKYGIDVGRYFLAS